MVPRRNILSLKRVHHREVEEEDDNRLQSSTNSPIRTQLSSKRSSVFLCNTSSDSSSDTSSQSSSRASEKGGSTQKLIVVEEEVLICPASQDNIISLLDDCPASQDNIISLLNDSKDIKEKAIVEPENMCADPQPGPSLMMLQDNVISLDNSTIVYENPIAEPENMCADPQPGPSCYEDISFEPLATSTPRRLEDDVMDAVASGICEINATKSEVRNGDMLLKLIEFEYLQDIRKSLKEKSVKHLLKLTERRIHVSKSIAKLIQQRNSMDALITSLSKQVDAIDDSVHRINYLIDHFPY